MAPQTTLPVHEWQYIIVEDIPDVARRLQHEMNYYPRWVFSGHALGVRDARKLIDEKKPQLIFCDWDLVGGSGFEVLQHVQQLFNYSPFVVFNTGFQSDHPEIAEELINTYKPDAFINKPYWQKLLAQLPGLLQRADQKASEQQQTQMVWVKTALGERVRIDAKNITAIVQCSENPRNKLIYLSGTELPIATTINWQQATDFLEKTGQLSFPINRRYALVNRQHVKRYHPPFIWVGKPQLKLEVVKENLKAFEKWMQG